MHITASILKHLFYKLQHQNYMIYCFTTAGVNVTGPNSPEGLGSQFRSIKDTVLHIFLFPCRHVYIIENLPVHSLLIHISNSIRHRVGHSDN